MITPTLTLQGSSKVRLKATIIVGQISSVRLLSRDDSGVPDINLTFGPLNVLIFNLDQGGASSNQGVIELAIDEVSGQPGQPFLEIEFAASGDGSVVVRIGLPGSVEQQFKVEANTSARVSYHIYQPQVATP